MTDYQLIQYAEKAMAFAYTPYSNFKVGAALYAESGKVYTGCNIENSSYGATICAERTALAKAVSEGEHKFKKIAVVCSMDQKAYPCGICLQVLSEFMPHGEVILQEQGQLFHYTLDQLLPMAFSLNQDSE